MVDGLTIILLEPGLASLFRATCVLQVQRHLAPPSSKDVLAAGLAGVPIRWQSTDDMIS